MDKHTHTHVPWTLTSGSTTTTASPGVGTAAHNTYNLGLQINETKINLIMAPVAVLLTRTHF